MELDLRSSNDANTARGACGVQVDSDASSHIEENDTLRSIYFNMMISKKHKYRSENRQHCLRRVSNMRSCWMAMAQKNKTQIRAIKCFKRLKCFKVAHVSYLKEKMVHMFSLSYKYRRLVAGSIFKSGNTLLFDGNVVCINILRLAFRLIPRLLHTISKVNDGSSIGSARRHWFIESKDAVICFMERVVDRSADKIPDT